MDERENEDIVRFEQQFLAAITALDDLGLCLSEIGMSGCTELSRLQTAIVKHGAETHRTT